MGAEAKTDRLEGALLALLEHEERLARWVAFRRRCGRRPWSSWRG